MNLENYIQSELEEEKALGLATASTTGASSSAYPGDDAVFVPDSDVRVERMRVSVPDGDRELYVARPAADGRAPAVLVIHENKGLVPYIENVARRLAREGYVAVAPDLLSAVGGTGAFERPSDATDALKAISEDDIVADLRAVLTEVGSFADVESESLGVVGFCYGGGVAWRLATQEDRLRAAVPFYGPPPDPEAVPGIRAPVLAVYGERDERITSTLPSIRETMRRHGKTFESLVLDGAQHAFHNDANPDRYDAEAAAQAWSSALAWLDRWLRKADPGPAGRRSATPR